MPVIATNVAANTALLYLNRNSSTESSTLAKLASGSNMVKASDDAAGLAIGTELKAQAAFLTQNASNLSQGVSILQVADSGLSSISDILTRMMSLATEAASSNVSDTQRSNDISAEFGQLASEISTIENSTTYGGQALLISGFSAAQFVVGTNSSGSAVTVSIALGDLTGSSYSSLSTVAGYSSQSLASASGVLGTTSGAQALVSTLSAAIDDITGYRATVGAYESQLNYSLNSVDSSQTNVSAAQSTVMDADEAALKSQLSSADVLSQASIAALSQASKMPQELLTLLQS